jgi:hypothetical protein
MGQHREKARKKIKIRDMKSSTPYVSQLWQAPLMALYVRCFEKLPFRNDIYVLFMTARFHTIRPAFEFYAFPIAEVNVCSVFWFVLDEDMQLDVLRTDTQHVLSQTGIAINNVQCPALFRMCMASVLSPGCCTSRRRFLDCEGRAHSSLKSYK